MVARVMVVDEDPTLVRLCRLVLEREGFEVFGAFSGAQCLDSLAKDDIDLVLLDLPLDDTSGMDLLRTIQQNDRWGNIPVILISNLRRDQAREQATSPLAGFIRKPFQIEHLLKEVRSCLISV